MVAEGRWEAEQRAGGEVKQVVAGEAQTAATLAVGPEAEAAQKGAGRAVELPPPPPPSGLG